jgi:hypothetical protein
MDTMRPRIIHSEDGTIDASKVSYVSQIKKDDSGLGGCIYSFHAHTDDEVMNFNSEDLLGLQEVRRRLIGFIWPNADVFDLSKINTAPDL